MNSAQRRKFARQIQLGLGLSPLTRRLAVHAVLPQRIEPVRVGPWRYSEADAREMFWLNVLRLSGDNPWWLNPWWLHPVVARYVQTKREIT